MVVKRPAPERGRTRLDWLDSRHTFSFGDYDDPAHRGFRVLRVLNDDRVAAGGGFPSHGHRDMEILTYVVSGALAHRDSLGNGTIIRAGEVQRMTAGTGVVHSEYNASDTDPVHFLQMWIVPATRGLPPGYAQRPADHAPQALFASPDGRDGSIAIHQDASLHGIRLNGGDGTRLPLGHGRHAWVQVVDGMCRVGTVDLGPGDGAAISDETAVALHAAAAATVLVFDLP